jgi:hypothetical protein
MILENVSPLVQVVARSNPFYFYTYHNELAFELAESGRLDEAQAACEVALASPYATAYPEWRETGEEIAEKRQTASTSVVFITRELKADISPQAQTRRVCAPGRPAVENATMSVDVIASITPPGLSQTILDRLGKTIRPRAPPGSSVKLSADI